MDTARPRGKEGAVGRTALILFLFAALAPCCAETPPAPAASPTLHSKPAPPPDATLAPRRTPAPTPTRGTPAASPSTGEPVEVHRSR